MSAALDHRSRRAVLKIPMRFTPTFYFSIVPVVMASYGRPAVRKGISKCRRYKISLFGFGRQAVGFADLPQKFIDLQFMPKAFLGVERHGPLADVRQNAAQQISGYTKIKYGACGKTVHPGEVAAPVEVVRLEILSEFGNFHRVVDDSAWRVHHLRSRPK